MTTVEQRRARYELAWSKQEGMREMINAMNSLYSDQQEVTKKAMGLWAEAERAIA